MATAAVSRLRGLGLGTLPVAILIAALFVVLVLMRDSVANSEALSRAFVPLLFVVLAGLGVLALLVGFNVVRLVRRYRQQAAGSRLTARIVALFAVLSLLPVGTVYYFSLGFLLRGIDSWFDVEIGQAMEDALVLNQASLDLNQRVLAKYTEQLLVSIEDRSSTAIALSLDSLRRQAGAIELTVYGGNGQVLANASEDPTKLVPNHAEREIQQSVRAGNNYVGLDSVPGADLVVRVLVNDPLGRPMQMQAIFPTSARIGELSDQLEAAYNRYTELAYLRNSLKLSFSLTLSLVLLFSLMAALIVAFHTARRLVAPVADIARASRAIAEGDYGQQIPLPRHDDELAFLVASFNAMSRRIARARDAAERSQQAVETQRNYLETVLGRLSSGVAALDAEHRLRTANPAARAILDLEIAEATAVDLDQIAAHHPWLSPWTDTVRQQVASGQAWRAEVQLQRQEGSQTLMCRGSPLPGGDDEPPGHVVVFDDITSLITAQREAAWGEVARRLAHEIKNPLTPIQLSAERLRHKLLRKAEEADARVIDRATHTIIQQVEAMKAMVNDFSDYARSPQLRPEPLVFDRLVREVLDLYRSAGAGALQVALGADEHQINGDALRLRQVLHNLIKNAQEALEGNPDGRIRVVTGVRETGEQHGVWLEISDNGPGFEPHLMERLFEPYVTTKAKGTGLGLAIVKRIIEEHGGIIVVENTGSGARIEIRLPVWQPPGRDAQARGTHTET
ncbi:sensor histidine kinase [Marichromatium gracile]|uniref:histidine kinase n=1 Tax=Marichromatium gracile TaxID=1048 RepID=A0ABR5VIC3_MARGR|nr:ATP-binding protein [Marichromatium gracile]KXX65071.1 PAS domain-containing sensor histidine kinase [Marichromatium gracile]